MTFSFMPKNAKSSLPNNAREQPSRKYCKQEGTLHITFKGHLLGALFLCTSGAALAEVFHSEQ
jgi:hypothetical protein